MTMARNTLLAMTISLLLTPAMTVGQTAAQKPTAPAATQPNAKAGQSQVIFEVVELQGSPVVGPVGLKIGKDGWTPLKLRDRLGAGDVVFTSLRSKVKLAALPAKPPTVMMLESGTLLNIEEAAIVNGVAKVRLGLGYGAVRAGVAEGQVRSDMEITCPVATLSKKGTDIFRFEYDNGRFNMSLSPLGRGMLQALQFRSGKSGGMRSRFVTPGQFVTHRMGQTIDNVKFSRGVSVNDVFGIRGNDRLFTLMNNHGFGFLLPQGGSMAFFGAPNKGLFGHPGFLQQGQRFPRRIREAFNQHDGNFGIGQGSLPAILTGGSLGSPLQQHAVTPGYDGQTPPTSPGTNKR